MAQLPYPAFVPFFLAVSILTTTTIIANAEQTGSHDMDGMMMPGHDHTKMQHGMMPSQQHAAPTHSAQATESGQDADIIANRDPHAYSEGLNFMAQTRPMMGDEEYMAALIVDRLEGVNVRDDFSMTYDWQAWYGKDYDRLLARAEGEIDQGQFKGARNELLWAHALTAFWDTQLGVRYDSGQGNDRVWGAFGFQGYAPYWIYLEATGYVGEQGRTAFRLEIEYDVLFTQKLILQPRVETNFYSDSDPSRLISSGLSNIEAGLRLRYEFKREIAPYIGIEWASTFGSAADIIRAHGNKAEETRFVAGVHFWF